MPTSRKEPRNDGWHLPHWFLTSFVLSFYPFRHERRHPLFCTLKGKPVQRVYVRNLMKRLAVKVGIEKRMHPHGRRHTHAHELESEGTPLHVIQQHVGHSSLATTNRYIRRLNPRQVVDAIRGREWG